MILLARLSQEIHCAHTAVLAIAVCYGVHEQHHSDSCIAISRKKEGQRVLQKSEEDLKPPRCWAGWNPEENIEILPAQIVIRDAGARSC